MTDRIVTSRETATGSGLAPSTPWHLWAVGALTLVFNAGGAFDYTMTQTRNEAYLANFTEEQLIYFNSFPAWSEAFWALGVWGALVGSILILLRSRYAVWSFAVALIGLAGSTVYQFGIADMPDSIRTGGAMMFTIIIWAVTIATFLYARAMTKRGVLR
ncbi:hypothetical protein WJT74_09315 [Sphingomicrobium sp. XHP0239]|uniref:hypothetical protein n=1 Tax=Sphingomicrobium maritimum TaxID=3133972 RepID=UPI0031CC3B54